MAFARVTTSQGWTNTAHSMRASRGCQRERFSSASRRVWEIAMLTEVEADEYDAPDMPSDPEGTIVSAPSAPSAVVGRALPPQPLLGEASDVR